MLTTSVFAAWCVVSIALQVTLWSWCLRWGLRWVGRADVTLTRCFVVAGWVLLAGVLLAIGFSIPTFTDARSEIAFGVVAFATPLAVSVAIVSRLLRLGARKAFLAWLPTLTASAVSIALAFLCIRPFVFESFYVPTNSMAPTIRGPHLVGTCPECGGPAYGAPVDPQARALGDDRDPVMICDGFHIHRTPPTQAELRQGDRFMAAKFVRPRRWDMIVFRLPQDPKQVYVKRLVGLPGETVVIANGSVCIDGVELSPPARLDGLIYVTEHPDWGPMQVWGTEANPAILGEGEYFVLGDFTTRALDSRLWQQGAAGRSPYAVPEDNLIGVVSHLFWPIPRMSIVR